MFNARQETVSEKPVFKRLLGPKRCAVMYNGFYEWKKEGSGKVPHYIYLQEEKAMFMAGLYDKWEGTAYIGPCVALQLAALLLGTFLAV